MGRTGRTASLTAIIIVASTDRAHANAPCIISAVLYAYVLSRLQYWSGLVQHDEERLLKRLLNANDKGQAAARKKQAAELNKAEKRKAEVDTLFARMYEDWAAGRITEYNFSMLSGKYQSEHAELDTKIEKILVHEAVKSEDGSREQEVEIFYRFIGKID